MDSKRARDIVVAKETASIHFLDHPQKSQEVHLTQLVENE